MLAIERRNEILAKLLVEGKVIVSDLSRAYNVTEETIRRDLEKLENDGLAKKTYGGAVRNESLNVDVPYNVRKQANVLGKQHIASIIASMVDDGDYLVLDASTTALSVVKSIMHKRKITLITNSIEILLELANKTDWNILSTGGVLKEGGLSLVGYQAERMIGSFHVDLAVCSCKGLDMEMGITDSNERDAEIKKAFFKAAKRKVLAADSTKFEKISFVQIANLQDVDVVVTDERPSEAWIQHLSGSGVELMY
ncbi:MAG TPA: DeoR/GlpR transcriptional regulator [Candidatus Faecaligallichristensenella faecipullorum]|nr:DeoR/GlpR transcriptional regulator [Candidatus Faecaligallichristensenella faecipullorum]